MTDEEEVRGLVEAMQAVRIRGDDPWQQRNRLYDVLRGNSALWELVPEEIQRHRRLRSLRDQLKAAGQSATQQRIREEHVGQLANLWAAFDYDAAECLHGAEPAILTEREYDALRSQSTRKNLAALLRAAATQDHEELQRLVEMAVRKTNHAHLPVFLTAGEGQSDQQAEWLYPPPAKIVELIAMLDRPEAEHLRLGILSQVITHVTDSSEYHTLFLLPAMDLISLSAWVSVPAGKQVQVLARHLQRALSSDTSSHPGTTPPEQIPPEQHAVVRALVSAIREVPDTSPILEGLPSSVLRLAPVWERIPQRSKGRIMERQARRLLVENGPAIVSFVQHHLELNRPPAGGEAPLRMDPGTVHPECERLTGLVAAALALCPDPGALLDESAGNLGDSFLRLEPLWDLASPERKLKVCMRNLRAQDSRIAGSVVEEMVLVLPFVDEQARWLAVSRLPPEVKFRDDVLATLGPDRRTSALAEVQLAEIPGLWPALGTGSKIALCRRIASSGDTHLLPLDKLVSQETNLLVRAILRLLMAKCCGLNSTGNTFDDFHRDLDQYVQANWETCATVQFHGLLPGCPNKLVRYCERRQWRDKRDGTVAFWCPRARKVCQPNDAPDVTPSDGRLRGCIRHANTSSPWRAWTFWELLAASDVTPSLPRLSEPSDYVPKIGGWINRMEEVKSRLRCSLCGELMRPDPKYAQLLAVYNATVFSCQKGAGHDTNVYLNHCWNPECHGVIDSRQDRFRFEKWFLCSHCGSGPEESKTYRQGDICAKCGAKKMLAFADGKRCRCNECTHEIELPSPKFLTGTG